MVTTTRRPARAALVETTVAAATAEAAEADDAASGNHRDAFHLFASMRPRGPACFPNQSSQPLHLGLQHVRVVRLPGGCVQGVRGNAEPRCHLLEWCVGLFELSWNAIVIYDMSDLLICDVCVIITIASS